MTYQGEVYERRELWAICCRTNVSVRGNNTNNYCEAAVLMRRKAFNALQLVDFIVTRMESFYERRIIDFANSRLNYVRHSKYLAFTKSEINLDEIQQNPGTGTYRVPSEGKTDTFYDVDMDMGQCTCHTGLNGEPGKHQGAVVRKFKVGTFKCLSTRGPCKICEK